MKKYLHILFFLYIVNSGCDLFYTDNFDLNEVNMDEVLISFRSSKDTLLANGQDKTELFLELPENANEDVQVKLKSINSIFNESKDEIELVFEKKIIEGVLKNVATVELFSLKKVGPIKVVASYLVWSDTLHLESKRVFPKKISTSVDSKLLQPFFNSVITIDGKLSNLNTPISLNHPVTLVVEDTLGTRREELFGIELIEVLNSNSDNDSMVKFKYTAGETDYVGKLLMILETKTDKQETIRDTATVFISPNGL